MECPACMKWLVAPVILVLATHSWLGCSQSDLSGYRPANGHLPASGSGSPVEQTQTNHQKDEWHDSASVAPISNPKESPSGASGDSNASEVPVSALLPVNVVDGANVRSVLNLPANDPQAAVAPVNVSPDLSDKKAAPEPHKIELLVKEKSFRTEPKTGALRVSFDDLDLLKILNMEPVVENAPELMPDWLRGLNDKSIRIRGFMYPTYDTEGIEHFVLARDNQICCFGRDPKIYDLIQVDMKPGKTTNYIPATRSFDVIGKFRIQMQSEDGKPYGLYVIDQAEVIDH